MVVQRVGEVRILKVDSSTLDTLGAKLSENKTGFDDENSYQLPR